MFIWFTQPTGYSLISVAIIGWYSCRVLLLLPLVFPAIWLQLFQQMKGASGLFLNQIT